MTRFGQRCMCVLWPSFLAAAILEMMVFAFVSPDALSLGQSHLEANPAAVYTVAFFIFWAVTAISSMLTVTLSIGREELNNARP